MAWDFETDAEYQVLLDWTADFVEKKVAPLDMVLGSAMNIKIRTSFAWCVRCNRKSKKWGFGPVIWGLSWADWVLVN